MSTSPKYERFLTPIKVATYNKVDIHMIERGRFKPDSPELFSDHEAFDSVDLTCKEIDARLTVKNKQERAKLNLHGYTGNGEECTIVSIHQGTGHTIGATEDFYPQVEWVIEDINRRNELSSEVAVIDNRLHKIKISNKRCWGRVEPAQFAHYVDRLQREHKMKLDLANKGREAVTKSKGINDD